MITRDPNIIKSFCKGKKWFDFLTMSDAGYHGCVMRPVLVAIESVCGSPGDPVKSRV